jgi:hypothetical protein
MKVEKLDYQINWKAFRAGASFFIPCLKPPQARLAILTETNKHKYQVVTKIVIEDGVRGIRVWRV